MSYVIEYTIATTKGEAFIVSGVDHYDAALNLTKPRKFAGFKHPGEPYKPDHEEVVTVVGPTQQDYATREYAQRRQSAVLTRRPRESQAAFAKRVKKARETRVPDAPNVAVPVAYRLVAHVEVVEAKARVA